MTTRALAVATAAAVALLGAAGPAAAQKGYIANLQSNTLSVLDAEAGQVTGEIDLAMHPRAIAITPDGQEVWVANEATDTVTVVQTEEASTLLGEIEGVPIQVGDAPRAVAITPDGSRVYVANSGATTVSVIDAATRSVTASVAVGATPSGIAIAGGRAYVANTGSGTVSVIDTASNTVTATVPVGTGPSAVAIAAGKAYVANSASDTVSVIDTSDNSVDPTPIAVGDDPQALAVSPAGDTLYVVNTGDDDVRAYAIPGNTLQATIPVGDDASAIAITPTAIGSDGPLAYVTNAADGDVTAIDTATNTAVAASPLPAGDEPASVAVTPVALGPGGSFGHLVYVANFGDDSLSAYFASTNLPASSPVDVSVRPTAVAITGDGTRALVTAANVNSVWSYDTSTDELSGAPAPICVPPQVCEFPQGIAMTPSGDEAVVTSFDQNVLAALDASPLAPRGTPVSVGAEPQGVAITPNGLYAYVANSGADTVSKVRLSDGLVTSIPVAEEPVAVAVSPAGDHVYVATLGSSGGGPNGAVFRIDTSNDNPGSGIEVGQDPEAIAVSPDGTKVYVANNVDGTVHVIEDGAVTDTLAVDAAPQAVAFRPDGERAFVTHQDGTVTVIDTAGPSVDHTTSAGQNPTGLAIVPNQVSPAFAVPSQASLMFELDASASAASAGIASYRWSFGDGTTLESPQPFASHLFAGPGSYQISLAIEDRDGCSGTVFTGQTASCSGPPNARTTVQATAFASAAPGPRGPAGPPGPAGSPGPSGPQGPPGPLVTLASRRLAAAAGRRVRVGFVTTAAGRATLSLTRGRRQVVRLSRRVGSGAGAMKFRVRRPGRYRLQLTLRTADGRAGSDRARLRVSRREGHR